MDQSKLENQNSARPGGRNSGRHLRNGVRSIWWYIIPFVLINAAIFYYMTAQPDFTMEITDNGDYKTEDVTVTLKRSLLPLKSFTTKLDDEEITMEQVSKREYHTVIQNNGTLQVSAEFPNGMIKTQYASISAIDDTPPTITGEVIDEKIFTVSLEDTQSGINPASVYAVDADGKRVAPMASESADTTEVRFQALTDSLEVHAADQCGNEAIVSFDGLTALGNNGTDRSSDYNTYGTEESDSSSSSGSSSKSSSSSGTSSKSTGSTKSSSGSTTKSTEETTASKSTKTSSAKSSETTASSTKSSETKASETTASGTKSSETKTSETTASSTKSSETKASETTASGTKSSEAKTSETTASSTKSSETTSETKASVTAASETSAAETQETTVSAPGAVISESVSAPTAAAN